MRKALLIAGIGVANAAIPFLVSIPLGFLAFIVGPVVAIVSTLAAGALTAKVEPARRRWPAVLASAAGVSAYLILAGAFSVRWSLDDVLLIGPRLVLIGSVVMAISWVLMAWGRGAALEGELDVPAGS